MNEFVRNAVTQKMVALGISKNKLSQELKIDRSNISRMLNDRSGQVQKNWLEILNYFNLELIVREKPNGNNLNQNFG